MPEDALRAVVDTSVWISALINPSGHPAQILDAVREGRFVPVVSRALLDEVSDVVARLHRRRRYQISGGDLAALLSLLADRAVLVLPSGTVRLCRDPSDDFILETAVLGQARALVTRDDDLKRDPSLIAALRQRGIDILSVAQFLDRLATESPSA